MSQAKEQCELTPDSAEAKIQPNLEMDSSDKTTVLNLLEDIRKNEGAGGPPSRRSQDNGGGDKCVSEKQILDTLTLKGMNPESIKVLDNILVPEKTSAIEKSNVKFIVYDGPGAQKNHLDTVGSVLKATDPTLTDSNILYGSLAETVPIDKNKRPLVPYGVSGDDKTREKYDENIAYGRQVAADLNSFLPIVKSGDNVAINISADIFNLALVHPETSVKRGGYNAITPDELGIDVPKKVADFTQETVRNIYGALELRKDFDERAKTALSVMKALHQLADAGATIRIAWGNNDKILLTEMISQLHPNIAAVAATDASAKSADYNKNTARLAKENNPGTVLFLPESAESNIDRKKLGNVTVLKERAADDPISGERLGKVLVKDKDFPAIKKMLQLSAELTGSDRLNEGIVGRALQKEDYDKIYKAYFDRLQKSVGKNEVNQLGTQKEFLDNMHLLRLEKGNPDHRDQFRKKVEQAVVAMYSKELSKMGFTPETDDPTGIKKMIAHLEDTLKDKVFSSAQVKQIYGGQSDKLLSKENKGQNYFYRINAGDITASDAVDSYWAIKGKNNNLIMAREMVGTSFSSPQSAALERMKKIGAKK